MNGRTWSISGMAALLSMEVFCIDEHERSEKDRRSSLTFSCGSERKGIWHTSIELFLAVKKKSSRTEVAVASCERSVHPSIPWRTDNDRHRETVE